MQTTLRAKLKHWNYEFCIAWRQRRGNRAWGIKLKSDDVYVKICINELRNLRVNHED